MPTKIKFSLGQILTTPGALEAASPDTLARLLKRHAEGDWGEGVCKSDWKLNDHAVENGERILSSYVLFDGETKIWIISEADRSATTLLLPQEY